MIPSPLKPYFTHLSTNHTSNNLNIGLSTFNNDFDFQSYGSFVDIQSTQTQQTIHI